jgi:Cu(I)/Ag(I) efflux system protein CusF
VKAPFDPIHSKEKHMKRTTIAALTFIIAPLAVAQSGGMKGMDMNDMDMKGMDKSARKSQAQSHRGAGTVKSVDLGKGTLTIAHGPVASVGWPAMTMTFKAKDGKILEAAEPGQKITFQFIQQGRDYVVTSVN